MGARNLREVNGLRLSDATLVADIASARDRFGDRAAVLVETTLLRRKAAAKFAFHSWLTLSWVDHNLWRRVVPKSWYYNVMVTGVKPS